MNIKISDFDLPTLTKTEKTIKENGEKLEEGEEESQSKNENEGEIEHKDNEKTDIESKKLKDSKESENDEMSLDIVKNSENSQPGDQEKKEIDKEDEHRKVVEDILNFDMSALVGKVWEKVTKSYRETAQNLNDFVKNKLEYVATIKL